MCRNRDEKEEKKKTKTGNEGGKERWETEERSLSLGALTATAGN